MILPSATSPASVKETLSGVSPLSFHLLIIPSNPRGCHLLGSIDCCSITCFSNRSWSSVSIIVKLEVRPTSSAWRRNIRAATEWNVPSITCSAIGPTIAATRSFISLAALLVKVTAKIFQGMAVRVPINWAIRAVKTLVLPVPAPDRTSKGPSRIVTA